MAQSARLRLEAVAAIHGAPAPGLEGHLRRLSAGGTNRVVELARRPRFGTGRTGLYALPGTPTRRAAARLLREPLGCVELLLASCKNERLAAIDTDERLIREGHSMTLQEFVEPAVIERFRGWRNDLSVRPMEPGYQLQRSRSPAGLSLSRLASRPAFAIHGSRCRQALAGHASGAQLPGEGILAFGHLVQCRSGPNGLRLPRRSRGTRPGGPPVHVRERAQVPPRPWKEAWDMGTGPPFSSS